jgi:hypothetical protein
MFVRGGLSSSEVCCVLMCSVCGRVCAVIELLLCALW